MGYAYMVNFAPSQIQGYTGVMVATALSQKPVRNEWSDEARQASIEARKRKSKKPDEIVSKARKGGYNPESARKQKSWVTKWEQRKKLKKIDPDLEDYDERLVEQQRDLGALKGSRMARIASAVGLKQTVEKISGVKAKHSSWVDRKTGRRYDYVADPGITLGAIFGRVPGKLIETAPDGTKRELRGPQYNLFKRNCQMAHEFLPKYIEKFNELREAEMRTDNEVAMVLSVINEWSDEARAAALEARRRKSKKGAFGGSNKAMDRGAKARGSTAHSKAQMAHGTARGQHLRAMKKTTPGSKEHDLHKAAYEHHKGLGEKHKSASGKEAASFRKHMAVGALSGSGLGALAGRALLGKGWGKVGAMAGFLPGTLAGQGVQQLRKHQKVDQGDGRPKKVSGEDVGLKVGGAATLGVAAILAGLRAGGVNRIAKRVNPARYKKIVQALYKASKATSKVRMPTKDTARRAANTVRKALKKPLKGEVLGPGLEMARSGIGRSPNRLRLNHYLQVINGGPGSGHHGHKGIKGQRGGSLPDGESSPSGRTNTRSRTSEPRELAETPQARARRTKRVFTKTSKLAEVFDRHAEALEARRRKKKLPLSQSELESLTRTHAIAAKNFHDSAEQATMVKKVPQEEQEARLIKAEEHERLARKYASRLGRSEGRRALARDLGGSFVKGLLGGTVKESAQKLAEGTAKVVSDVGTEALRSGSKEALGKIRERKGFQSQAAKERERAQQYHGMARVAVETKAKKMASAAPGLKEILKTAGGAAGRRASERAKEHRESFLAPQSDTVLKMKHYAEVAEQRDQVRAQMDAVDYILGRIKSKPKGTKKETWDKALASARQVIGNSESTLTTLTANFEGQVRKETLHGREYLVAPLSMIVPGILAGSKGPLLYPEDEVGRNPSSWNHIPIVVNHPMKDGFPVEARSPEILEKYQIGFVFNAKYSGKLAADGWFDVERTRKTNIGIYENLVNNQPIELSTGLHTDNIPSRGTWKGQEYTHVARNYRPDHLAILLGSRGACSIKDGCGVLVNKWSDEARRASAEARKRSGSAAKESEVSARASSKKASTSKRSDQLHRKAGTAARTAEKKALDAAGLSKLFSKYGHKRRAKKMAKLATEHERIASGGLLKQTIKQRKKSYKAKKTAGYAGSVAKRVGKGVVTAGVPLASAAIAAKIYKQVNNKWGDNQYKNPDGPDKKKGLTAGKVGRFAGGAALGAGGALAGMKAGAVAGSAVGALGGNPITVGLGMFIGGSIGAAAGGWGAGKIAKKVGGETAETGAFVGEFAGGIGGLVKGGARMAGRGFAKAAIPRARNVQQVASTATRVPVKAKLAGMAGSGARLAGETAADGAIWAGTRTALDKKFPDQKKRPTRNAWTEAARRKSAETRRRNKASSSESTPGARDLGLAGAALIGASAGKGASKIRKDTPAKIKKAVAKSFADKPRFKFDQATQSAKKVRSGLGRSAVRAGQGASRKVAGMLKKIRGSSWKGKALGGLLAAGVVGATIGAGELGYHASEKARKKLREN